MSSPFLPLPMFALVALPLLICACATENTGLCVGVGSPNATVAGGVTVESAAVPKHCGTPGSQSDDVPTP